MTKEIVALADLTPDSANPNKGSARGRYMIEASLQEAGAGRSILVDANGQVIAGNQTLEAWADMGGEIVVVPSDGTKLVVVQRTDLDLDDPTGPARKLSFYDNRSSEVSLTWSAEDLLGHIGAGLDLDSMFSDRELEKLIGGQVDIDLDFDAEPDADNEPVRKEAKPASSADKTPTGANHVVQVALFFDTESHPPFVEQAKRLMAAYGIDNLSDLVRKVVEDADRAITA